MKKMLLLLAVVAMLTGCGETSEMNQKPTSPDLLDSLSAFTEADINEEKSEFYYKSDEGIEWVIVYSDENDFVKIYDDNLADQLTEFGFDYTDFATDHTFAYDFSDKEFRMYFNDETTDMDILQYSVEDDEFAIMKDSEWYYTSDTFAEFLEDYKIADLLKTDLNKFEKDITSNGLDINDIYKN